MPSGHYRIVNINGTSSKRFRLCDCGNWTKHWIRVIGIPFPNRCLNIDCKNPIEAHKTVGAHVRLAHGNAAGDWWIVPLCQKCNRSSSIMTVPHGALASANRSRMGCYSVRGADSDEDF